MLVHENDKLTSNVVVAPVVVSVIVQRQEPVMVLYVVPLATPEKARLKVGLAIAAFEQVIEPSPLR